MTSQPNHAPKKRGDLAATLDPLLEPRRSAGQPGRTRGVSNYEWTPETDRLLAELCAKRGAAKAKHIVGRKIQEGRPTEAAPRPDSVRKAVEYRMAKLGHLHRTEAKGSPKSERQNAGRNRRLPRCWVLSGRMQRSNQSRLGRATA